jgi:TonB family protein
MGHSVENDNGQGRPGGGNLMPRRLWYYRNWHKAREKDEGMPLRTWIIVLSLAVGGCSSSQVEVDVDSDGRDPHEKIFSEELGPRSGDYEKPKVFYLQPATYGHETLALDVSGIVMVKLLIGATGDVLESEIVQSVHPDVDRSAREAALRGKYRPARLNDVAVEGWLTVPYRFPPAPD